MEVHSPWMRRLSCCLVVLLVVAQAVLWWRVFAWWPELPLRIPIHFNFAGEPDGWANKSVLAWFGLPSISLVMTAFLLGIGAAIGVMARNSPALINVPRKEIFMQLSPEGRLLIIAPTRVFLMWVAALISMLFVWIVEGSARVAVGIDSKVPIWPVFVLLGLIFSTLPFFMSYTKHTIDAQAVREGLPKVS
jgi:uncharacterized membrane protein